MGCPGCSGCDGLTEEQRIKRKKLEDELRKQFEDQVAKMKEQTKEKNTGSSEDKA